ncbi:MAG: reverse transcriptase/maturase family protein, partial [Synergistaceae bacterium]|nr:reverse transcriptase/maturase family protein [Synergistaceae bacterium]
MARSYGGLWEQFITWENFITAYEGARESGKHSEVGRQFHHKWTENLAVLRQELIAGAWSPLPYARFLAYREPKVRQIETPAYRDRIVHHAIVQILEPIFERRFIYDSYSCRKGKGIHNAVDRAEQFIREAHAQWGKVYILKADISKFFPSIDHGILLKLIGAAVREARFMDVISKAFFAPGSEVGVPIGALTSQLGSNIYMDGLDHHIKDGLRTRYYLRYA